MPINFREFEVSILLQSSIQDKVAQATATENAQLRDHEQPKAPEINLELVKLIGLEILRIPAYLNITLQELEQKFENIDSDYGLTDAQVTFSLEFSQIMIMLRTLLGNFRNEVSHTLVQKNIAILIVFLCTKYKHAEGKTYQSEIAKSIHQVLNLINFYYPALLLTDEEYDPKSNDHIIDFSLLRQFCKNSMSVFQSKEALNALTRKNLEEITDFFSKPPAAQEPAAEPESPE